MKTIFLAIILFLFSGFWAFADISPKSHAEIAYLKKYIIDSSCIFTRNGINYKGSEAVTHILRKEDYFKDKISSTEDFIRLAATKSEISGKKYTVSCTKGTIENLGEWFLEELASYRRQKK